jgi:chitinase
VLLLKACREAMDAYGATLPQNHHFELTVASPAGPQNYNIMDLRNMDPYLDFWNLMAYDYAGSWDAAAGHQANLRPSKSNAGSTPFNTEQAIEYYKRQGVAAHKIVVGMPLYGRAFENTDGLGKPYQGVGEGTWESGVLDFKVLPHAGAEERYDEEAGASYSYDPAKRKLVTYDTIDMAMKKAEWVKNQGLGGAMWWEPLYIILLSLRPDRLTVYFRWESSADRAGEQSLIVNVVGSLGRMDSSPNCLDYPESTYDNLRNGFQG